MHPKQIEFLKKLKYERLNNTRPKPSNHLILGKSKISDQDRIQLLNKIAEKLDEDEYGRSDLCKHFALLLAKILGIKFKIKYLFILVKYHMKIPFTGNILGLKLMMVSLLMEMLIL